MCVSFFLLFFFSIFLELKKLRKKTGGMKRGKKWKLVRSTRVERHRHRDLGQALGSHKPCDLIWSWWRRSDDVDHNDDDCCRLSSSAQAGLTKVMKGGAGGQQRGSARMMISQKKEGREKKVRLCTQLHCCNIFFAQAHFSTAQFSHNSLVLFASWLNVCENFPISIWFLACTSEMGKNSNKYMMNKI